MTELPIVCTLSPEALNARKQGLLARVAALSKRAIAIGGGRRFEFDANQETLSLIAQMIDAERQCCRFLRFDLTVEPNCGPISLELTGPPGTEEFLSALLDPA
jgi:hypothetical protein